MKIAISANGTTLHDSVDLRFGRAKYFGIFDTETKQYEIVENSQNVNAASGAGIHSASLIAHQGALAVITGNCGPKAFAVLRQAGIAVYLTTGGSVEAAIQALQAGKLTAAVEANVAEHW